MRMLHTKTGNAYYRLGTVLDISHGGLSVLYLAEGGQQLFIRAHAEFNTKFDRHPQQSGQCPAWPAYPGAPFCHRASGHTYHTRGQAIDATNARDGTQVVVYQRDPRPGEWYCKTLADFARDFVPS